MWTLMRSHYQFKRLIWSWPTLCSYNSLSSSRKGLGVCLWEFLTILLEFICEVRHWRWMRSLAFSAWIHLESVLSGWGQDCRPVKLLHTKLAHPCLYGPCFVHWCAVMLEQEGAFPKLLPQSWEDEIVQNVLVLKQIIFSLEVRSQAQPLKNNQP